MKLWLDDERDPKHYKGWETALVVFGIPEEAIDVLDTGLVTHLSLDNDLGLPDDREGYKVALWVEEKTATDPFFVPPNVLNAHTASPVAGPKMEAAFRKVRQMMAQRR